MTGSSGYDISIFIMSLQKGNTIELQGEHRRKVKEALIQMGFPPETIEVK